MTVDQAHVYAHAGTGRKIPLCYLREVEGRTLRYCFEAKRIMKPGVERC
jgi:hypothetical protein